jgi:cytochrome c-type biogenesis protein CcmH/NrfF
MDETAWTLMDIVGPIILLILLVWVVLRARSRRKGEPPEDVTEKATREAYREEEEMRRKGTDDR